MKKGSLFLPLQQMADASPLLSSCLHSIHVNKHQIMDGVNSLDGGQHSYELVITKIDGREERIKVNMTELKEKTCASDDGGGGVTILILVLGIVAVIIACRWRKGRKVLTSDVVKVNVETETVKVKCREDFHYDNGEEDDCY